MTNSSLGYAPCFYSSILASNFNFSEWLGTVSAVSLSNMYHPGNKRGFVPSAESVGFSVLSDMGFDTLREFWPEISHEFKLPFRMDSGIEGTESNPAIK